MHYRWIKRVVGAGAVGSAIVGLAGCRYGVADTAGRLPAPFVAPGATAITVTTLDSNDWKISYQAPGSPSAWYEHTARLLKADGWTSPDQPAYAPLNRTFVRSTPVAVGEVHEWAFVYLDPFEPRSANIRVRRRLDVPWWRRVKRLASQLAPTREP